MIFSNNFSYFSKSSSDFGFSKRTTLVGFLVYAAIPSSSLLLTKMYGIPISSQRIGMWLMTSTGETSAAMTQSPLAPFLIDLTTSLTPLLSFLSLLRCLTILRSLDLMVSLANGLAIGER